MLSMPEEPGVQYHWHTEPDQTMLRKAAALKAQVDREANVHAVKDLAKAERGFDSWIEVCENWRSYQDELDHARRRADDTYTVGVGFKQKGYKQTTLYIRDEVVSATFSIAGHCGGWPKGSCGWGVAAFKGSFWGA